MRYQELLSNTSVLGAANCNELSPSLEYAPAALAQPARDQHWNVESPAIGFNATRDIHGVAELSSSRFSLPTSP
jgi:hypothetical protein